MTADLSTIAAWVAALTSLATLVYFWRVRRETVQREELQTLRETDDSQWKEIGEIRQRLATVPHADSWTDMRACLARTEATINSVCKKMDTIENHVSMLLENELRGGDRK